MFAKKSNLKNLDTFSEDQKFLGNCIELADIGAYGTLSMEKRDRPFEQTNGKTNGQTDVQTDKQPDREKFEQRTDKQPDGQS